MYIVHRDVLTLYAGKSVNHPLLHMESFNISSLRVESLWLKAMPKNSNRISHLFLVVALYVFFLLGVLFVGLGFFTLVLARSVPTSSSPFFRSFDRY